MNLFKQTMEVGMYKNLADKLKSNPNLRCNATADCLEIVRAGHAAYSAVSAYT